jgi:hypothetical protein
MMHQHVPRAYFSLRVLTGKWEREVETKLHAFLISALDEVTAQLHELY